MPLTSIVNEKALSPETIIAAVLLRNAFNKLKMSQVAELILDLEKEGIDISKMLCYPTASAAYCDDLDRFVSKLVSFGYASDSSPIKLKPEGEKLCKEIVEDARKKENKEQLETLERILDSKHD
jgi:hypothetical protein